MALTFRSHQMFSVRQSRSPPGFRTSAGLAKGVALAGVVDKPRIRAMSKAGLLRGERQGMSRGPGQNNARATLSQAGTQGNCLKIDVDAHLPSDRVRVDPTETLTGPAADVQELQVPVCPCPPDRSGPPTRHSPATYTRLNGTTPGGPGGSARHGPQSAFRS